MSKSQISMTDLFLAILLFMGTITIFFVTWNLFQSRLNDIIPRSELELYTLQLTNQLIRSPGIPDNWEESQISRYYIDSNTRALLHLDVVRSNDGGVGGNGTLRHHDPCTSNSQCGSDAPVCCNVPQHGGYVCEVPTHHNGICSAGITPDSSPNGNDGFLQPNYPTDSPVLQTSSRCRITNCLEFDGINDYIAINNAPSLSGLRNFTIELWMYPTIDQSATEEHLIHKRDQWYIKLVSGMRPSFLINGIGQFNPNYTFNLSQWYHIALTNQNYIVNSTPTNTIVFYVNGVQVFSTVAIGTPMDSSYQIYIGKQDSNSNYFAGRIDEVRISNITRTQFNVAPPDIQAIGLAERDRVISERKLQAFNNLGYDQIRQISRIVPYNFYFVLLRGNQSILELGNYPTGESVQLRRNVIYQNETATVQVSLWR